MNFIEYTEEKLIEYLELLDKSLKDKRSNLYLIDLTVNEIYFCESITPGVYDYIATGDQCFAQTQLQTKIKIVDLNTSEIIYVEKVVDHKKYNCILFIKKEIVN